MKNNIKYNNLKQIADIKKLGRSNVPNVTWETLENVPEVFPADEHIHSYNELNDRPFGEDVGEVTFVECDGTLSDMYQTDIWANGGYLPAKNYMSFTEGMVVHLKVDNYNLHNGNRENNQIFEGDVVAHNGYIDFTTTSEYGEKYMRMTSDDSNQRYGLEEGAMGDFCTYWDVTMTSKTLVINTLPEKFIPDTISRTSHNHNEDYAPISHTHNDEYALIEHNHDWEDVGEEVVETVIANKDAATMYYDMMFNGATTYVPNLIRTPIAEGMTLYVELSGTIDSQEVSFADYVTVGAYNVAYFEPYFKLENQDNSYIIVSAEGANNGTISIKITEVNSTITPLPTKYLPEHLQFGEEVKRTVVIDNSLTVIGDVRLEADKEYKVLYDGTVYTTTSYSNLNLNDNPGIALGNARLYQSNYGYGDADLPFFFFLRNGEVTYTGRYADENVICEVYTEETSITPLDPKYLPVMTVNVTGINDDYTATMDKTYSEIREHIDNGGEVDCVFRVGTSATYHKLHVSGFNNSTLSFIGQGYSMTGVNELASFVHYILRIGDGFANWAEISMLA